MEKREKKLFELTEWIQIGNRIWGTTKLGVTTRTSEIVSGPLEIEGRWYVETINSIYLLGKKV